MQTNPNPELTDFQKEVNRSVEAFWQAAQAGHGRMMSEREVKLLAAYIAGMTDGLMEMQMQAEYSGKMLNAYIEVHGDDIVKEWSRPIDDVIEGEVVADEETAQASVGDGVDPSDQGTVEGTVLEGEEDAHVSE